jgi:hypothetical protein
MNEEQIVNLYIEGKSMREIAKQLETNHKLISRILKKNEIETRPTRNTRTIRKFSCKKKLLYNNMATHLRFNVDVEWLMQFVDIEKLKVLNRCVTSRDNRFDENDLWYKEYILKFYFDKQFNKIYNRWVESGKQFYFKPSVDHIRPKSEGGNNNVENLQFLTWFENRCKNNMSQEDWDSVKQNIQEYFV